VIRIREKYMIDTVRKVLSKVEVEEEDMGISFHKCSVEEWVVVDKLDQRKVKVCNTPLKSHLKRYSRAKLRKLQLIEIDCAKDVMAEEVKTVPTQHAQAARVEE
jgi:hypothetical protein